MINFLNRLKIAGAILITVLTFSLCLNAEKKPQTGKHGHKDKRMMMIHLLSMDDDGLEKTRKSVEKIQGMSPEEKKQMLDKIMKFRSERSQDKEKFKKAFGRLNHNERKQMRKYWESLSHEERKEKKRELKNMSKEEREAWRQKILPQQQKAKSPEANNENTERKKISADMMPLERILKAKPGDLNRILETIDRVQKMDPKKKKKLRQRLSNEGGKHPGKGPGKQRDNSRPNMRKLMKDKSPEEREAIRKKLKNMTPEERKTYIKSLQSE